MLLNPQGSSQNSVLGIFGAIWGVAGVSLLLGYAIVRLTPYAIELFSLPLEWYHWLALVVIVLFMAYSEGYKGFQLGAAPRVAARARYLRNNPSALHVLLGPLFCASYYHTTRRRMIARYILTTMIVLLIVIVHQIEQPWRGIIDAGVVVGLAWGLIAIWIYSIKALFSGHFDYSPELPDEQSGADYPAL